MDMHDTNKINPFMIKKQISKTLSRHISEIRKMLPIITVNSYGWSIHGQKFTN